MSLIENRTFDEIAAGDSASLTRTLSRDDIRLFAVMSGDVNPLHVDDEFARSDAFHKVIAHGMWGGALVSTVFGTELPGPGTTYLEQKLRFHHPVTIGDTVVVTVTVSKKEAAGNRVYLDCKLVNQNGCLLIDGEAVVIAPGEKISRPRVELPSLRLEDRGAWHDRLIARATRCQPLRTAVVFPTDTVSLLGAAEAAKAGLIEPVLIGPTESMRKAAAAADVDLSPYALVDAPDAMAAAATAVAMAAGHEVGALMKGALHTDILMHAVLAGEHRLCTTRRLSHVFAMDAPTYNRPLLVTDAAINIYPDLDTKCDIVQNAIDLAHALDIPAPRVAILSAVETVSAKIKSTLDAAALCKMAERGQIKGGTLDGPLAFDNAISAEAAKTKGIVSPVAGQADILVVPDMEAGNILAKLLEYLADAESAGIVVGASIPIILTSRADNTRCRMASCAIAVLLAQHQRQQP